jgi:hypothetical protein
LILKTIHESFNLIWLEHSRNNIYSNLSSSTRLKQGLSKSITVQDTLASSPEQKYSFLFRRRRSHKRLFRRVSKSRRTYNKLSNLAKYALNNLRVNRRAVIRLRVRPNNPVRGFYSNIVFNSTNFLRSKINATRSFNIRRRKRRVINQAKKKFKRLHLLKNKGLKTQLFLSKRKKQRVSSARKKYTLSTINLSDLKLNKSYRKATTLYNATQHVTSHSARLIHRRTSSLHLLSRKARKYKKYTKLKSAKLSRKKLYMNNYSPPRMEKIATRSPEALSSLKHKPTYDKGKLVENLSNILPKVSLRLLNAIKTTRISYLSIFLKYRLLILNLSFNSEKFLIRKRLFSFLKPNEAKKSIMNRRRKIQVSRLYTKLRKSNIISSNLSSLKPKTALLNKKMYMPQHGTHLNTFSTKAKHSYELFLPRVKFKPGYQRLWRQSRKAMADNIGLRYIYQKQMTKYMLRLSRQSYSYSFAMSESSIDKAILYSRLLPDLKTISDFMYNGFVSLNGWQLKNLNSFVLPGDFIQLTISKWLSIYFRWLVTWAKLSKTKFKNLVFRKGLASSYKLMKQRKQRSQYVPLWVYNSRFDISDIKPNFEVDYFTMSSMMLYEPLLIDYYTPDDLPDHRHYTYRLYNWKYIT